MKIVGISGGLGNQICQYTLKRYLEIVCGHTDIMFDDMSFSMKKLHNGFELDRIFPNIKMSFFKDNIDEDVWNHMVLMCGYSTVENKIRLPNIILENGVDIMLVADEYWHSNNGVLKYNWKFEGKSHLINYSNFYNPDSEVRNSIKEFNDIYYLGAWTTDKFAKDIKKELEHELKFIDLQYPENIAYRDDICSKELSIGVHIRRGDFITCGKDIPPKNYANTIKNLKFSLVREQASKPTFYIFSDDLTWCKENTDKLGFKAQDEIVFIEGNEISDRNYIDMQLMTYCDYLVHNTESSFCLAASFISEKNIKRIIC